MIMIDLLIPALDEIYDFEIDRNIGLREFTRNAVSIVEDREEVRFDDAERIVFFADKGELLNSRESLGAQGVDHGARLVLI